jgi:hypothetical protein
VTDYKYDPARSSIDVSWAHNLVPRDLYLKYISSNCSIWWKYLKPFELPGSCMQLLVYWDSLIKYVDVYDVRSFLDYPLNKGHSNAFHKFDAKRDLIRDLTIDKDDYL